MVNNDLPICFCSFNCRSVKSSLPYIVGNSMNHVTLYCCKNIRFYSLIEDKGEATRAAFLEWVIADKPRSGSTHQLLCRTRSSFKLALRYCRASS